MARDSHNVNWRTISHIIDVLDANVATELTADAPAGLNVTAPASEAYYAMPGVNAVRNHTERNHHVQVYVFPSSERIRHERSMGATFKSQPSEVEITIAVRVAIEAGAADYSASWKTLTPYEREFLRCETLLGAIMDCMDGRVRNVDDVNHVFFVDSTSGDDRFKRSTDDRTEVWGSARYRIHNIINVPVQQ
jgi:hypothetical protein